MHIPVLKDETINGLEIQTGNIVVDGTLGGGGHTLEIIHRFGSGVKIICLDLDAEAISRTKAIVRDLPRPHGNQVSSLCCSRFLYGR